MRVNRINACANLGPSGQATARASGVDASTVAGASESQKANPPLVPAARNEALLLDAGFTDIELFYRGMEWRGWVAYA